MSAFSDDAYLQGACDRGVFAYLVKPVTVEGLKAAIAVAWDRILRDGETTERVDHLELTLKNRQIVEKAKWRLVESHGLTEPEAHSRMQRVARDRRKPLAEIAQAVADGDDATVQAVLAAKSAAR